MSCRARAWFVKLSKPLRRCDSCRLVFRQPRGRRCTDPATGLARGAPLEPLRIVPYERVANRMLIELPPSSMTPPTGRRNRL